MSFQVTAGTCISYPACPTDQAGCTPELWYSYRLSYYFFKSEILLSISDLISGLFIVAEALL